MYESFYGLTALPFTLSPNPDFFFKSRGHRSARSYLDYRVSRGEGIIVLTGEVGAGKSTLLRGLVQAQDPKRVVVAQLVNSALAADDLLEAVALAFGVPQRPVAGASLLWHIEQFLHRQRRAGRRALLIIDEAQSLTVEGVEHLHALVEFKTDGVPLLQCLLVGQPELREIVKEAWTRFPADAPFPTYHLGPLEKSETRAYIEHRLRCVGWAGDPVFDADAMTLIHRVSGGVPRRINSLCNRMLLNGLLNASHRFDIAAVDAVADELARELGAYAEDLRPSHGFGRPGADAIGQSQVLMGPMGLSALTARLDVLERNAMEFLRLASRFRDKIRAQRRSRPSVPAAPR